MDAETEAAEARTEQEAAVLGRALKVLRIRSGLSQTDAGAKYGVSAQGWGQYELGRAASIFRPSIQRKLTGALGFTVADLLQEHARILEASAEPTP
jgi:transcriptional regulator with XRE-family HTH domain